MGRAGRWLLVGLLLAAATTAQASWLMEIESKTVVPNQTGVTLNFTYAWDLPIHAFTLPVVVRSLDPGSFWTGSLPYDTVNPDGNRCTNGVTWNPVVPPFAILVMEMRPGMGFPTGEWLSCDINGDTVVYNGISPDRFVINAAGINPMAAKPDGIVFLSIVFDVGDTPGQFEFDTACFSRTLNTIFMIDNSYTDRGPMGTNEVDFNKGVITVSPLSCDCSHQGDCTADGGINPLDVIYLVNYALRMSGPPPPADPACPALNRGDWDCNAQIDLTDIIRMVNYVYRYPAPGPCDPCATK